MNERQKVAAAQTRRSPSRANCRFWRALSIARQPRDRPTPRIIISVAQVRTTFAKARHGRPAGTSLGREIGVWRLGVGGDETPRPQSSRRRLSGVIHTGEIENHQRERLALPADVWPRLMCRKCSCRGSISSASAKCGRVGCGRKTLCEQVVSSGNNSKECYERCSHRNRWRTMAISRSLDSAWLVINN
jgi:hypothetical protein